MLEKHVLIRNLNSPDVPFCCYGFFLGIHDQIGSRMKLNLGYRLTQISKVIAGGYFCRTPPSAARPAIERPCFTRRMGQRG